MGFEVKASINWESGLKVAKEIIVSLKDKDIPGPAKRRKVVDEVTKLIDDALTWGDGPLADLFETLDDVAARLVVGFIVQSAYDILKKEGKV